MNPAPPVIKTRMSFVRCPSTHVAMRVIYRVATFSRAIRTVDGDCSSSRPQLHQIEPIVGTGVAQTTVPGA